MIYATSIGTSNQPRLLRNISTMLKLICFFLGGGGRDRNMVGTGESGSKGKAEAEAFKRCHTLSRALQ